MIPYILGAFVAAAALSIMLLLAHLDFIPRDEVLACTALTLASLAIIRTIKQDMKSND